MPLEIQKVKQENQNSSVLFRPRIDRNPILDMVDQSLIHPEYQDVQNQIRDLINKNRANKIEDPGIDGINIPSLKVEGDYASEHRNKTSNKIVDRLLTNSNITDRKPKENTQ